jgi:ribosomal protein S18 acetylase RimI-like enzyme
MTIREMRPDDLDAIVAIIADHEEWDEPYARTYFEDYFHRVNAKNAAMESNYVAEVDDHPIGVCGFAPPKFPSDDVLWGTWFYVQEQHRRTGAGAALVRHALDSVKAKGIRKIYLETSSNQIYSTAVEMYRSLGFEVEGTLKDYYDEGENLLIMGLNIAN